MAGLLYLQHAYRLSDEARWVENPYYQQLTGETFFQNRLPIDPSSLTRWRGRIGEEGVEWLLTQTIRAGQKSGVIAEDKRTTDSEHAWPVAPNLVAQDFTADGPDRKWGADISYIWTAEGWLYLAVVLDLFSRRVIGWATSDRLKRDLAVEALRRALVARNPASGQVHHSDRGSQYCSVDYQALLRRRGILISLSAIASNRLPATDERARELLR